MRNKRQTEKPALANKTN